MEYKLEENGFIVNVITDNPDPVICELMNDDLFISIRDDYTNNPHMHPAIRMLVAKGTKATVLPKKWNKVNDRKTYDSKKQFLISLYIANDNRFDNYYGGNNFIQKIVWGNGVKSAYLNFMAELKDFNKNMDGYKIKPCCGVVIVIDLNQNMQWGKNYIAQASKETKQAEKILNRLNQQGASLRQQGSNLNILCFKENSLYWIYRINRQVHTKVVINGDIGKISYLEASINSIISKKVIDADAIMVSRAFVDHVQLKCGIDAISKLYEAIKGNLAIGVAGGTSTGQELKDPSVVQSMFEINDGTVWSKQKSVQAWKKLIGQEEISINKSQSQSQGQRQGQSQKKKTQNNRNQNNKEIKSTNSSKKEDTIFNLIIDSIKLLWRM